MAQPASGPTPAPFTALYHSGAGGLSPVPDATALALALADAEGLVWVDFLTGEEEAGALLRDVFRFHPLTIEDALSPRLDPAKIDEHADYLFIVTQAISSYVPGQTMELVEADFYLGRNYVVSCHREPLPAISRFVERCEQDEYLLSRGADWLLHGLVDELVDEYLPVVDQVDDEIDALEEAVLARPDANVLQRIMVTKRNTLRLRRAITPQRDIMNRLSRGEFPHLIGGETAIYYRDVYDHLVRVEALVEGLRDLADGALSTYLSAVSNRLNEVMKALTLVATIFLPLTLISGIFGMNFEESFPPFDARWGFYAVAGFMLAVAAGFVAYFRYRRWV